MQNFLPDRSDAERLEILTDSADHIEDTTFYKDLTEEDLTIKRETFVENNIEISKHQEILDIAKAEYKANTKPLTLHNEILLTEIKTRKASVKGKLFHIADHDLNVMNTFDEKGEFISSRRLRPDEKQTRITSLRPAVNQ